MSNGSRLPNDETSLWLRVAFGVSFYLPGLFMALCLIFDIDNAPNHFLQFGLGWGLVLAWIFSVLAPLAVIAFSNQKWLVKSGLVLFAAVVWIIVQIFVFLIIGAAAMMKYGFSGPG